LFVPVVYDDELPGDVRYYKLGEWVKYNFRSGQKKYVFTIKVVAREGKNLWVELIKKHGDTEERSVRLVNKDDRITKAFYKTQRSQLIKQRIIKRSPEPSKINHMIST
jgi:hypothetical protein